MVDLPATANTAEAGRMPVLDCHAYPCTPTRSSLSSTRLQIHPPDGLLRACVKAIRLPGGISFGRSRFFKHSTYVDEMLLRCLTLPQGGVAPFLDEFLWCHSGKSSIMTHGG